VSVPLGDRRDWQLWVAIIALAIGLLVQTLRQERDEDRFEHMHNRLRALEAR
jgi:hypothetical protein